MTTLTTEEQTAQEPKATTKANAAPRKPRVTPAKPKSAKKTTPSKKAAKAPKKATSAKAEGARQGSTTEKILDLLKRPGGATLKELMKATGWQAHSVRGFLSILGKKKGLAVESTKSTEGERTYSIKS
jgi:N-acetylmuramoyl-L-alanine amidase CwlA